MGRTERTVHRSVGGGEEREVIDAPQDSVEVSTTAKGEVTFSVKVYACDAMEARARLDALVKIAQDKAAEIKAGKGVA